VHKLSRQGHRQGSSKELGAWVCGDRWTGAARVGAAGHRAGLVAGAGRGGRAGGDRFSRFARGRVALPGLSTS